MYNATSKCHFMLLLCSAKMSFVYIISGKKIASH